MCTSQGILQACIYHAELAAGLINMAQGCKNGAELHEIKSLAYVKTAHPSTHAVTGAGSTGRMVDLYRDYALHVPYSTPELAI